MLISIIHHRKEFCKQNIIYSLHFYIIRVIIRLQYIMYAEKSKFLDNTGKICYNITYLRYSDGCKEYAGAVFAKERESLLR